jgi:hypothetical protein
VDPELSELLGSEVPHRADGTVDFSIRFHEAFRTALAPHTASFGTKIDLDTRAFVVANMVDALGHAGRRFAGRAASRGKGKSRILRGASCVSCLLIRHCGSLINSAHAQRSGLALFEALGNSGLSIDAVVTPRWFSATRKLSAWRSPSRSGEGRGFP